MSFYAMELRTSAMASRLSFAIPHNSLCLFHISRNVQTKVQETWRKWDESKHKRCGEFYLEYAVIDVLLNAG
jgi:hypothetical protein